MLALSSCLQKTIPILASTLRPLDNFSFSFGQWPSCALRGSHLTVFGTTWLELALGPVDDWMRSLG